MKRSKGGKARLKLVQPPEGTKRRRRLKGFLMLLLIPAMGLLLFKAGAACCSIDQITVTGNSRLSEAELISQSGVKKGTSLLLLKSGQAEKKLAALPELYSAEITKSFPSTVRIMVKEREAAASLLDQNCFWLVDGEGVLFVEQPHPAENLPVVTGAVPDEISAGRPLMQGNKCAALRAFLESLPRIPLLEPAELHLADPANLILYTADGRRVLLGDSSKMFDKLVLLQAFLQENGTGRCLDLRTGDRLVVVSDQGGGPKF